MSAFPGFGIYINTLTFVWDTDVGDQLYGVFLLHVLTNKSVRYKTRSGHSLFSISVEEIKTTTPTSKFRVRFNLLWFISASMIVTKRYL